MSGELTVAHEHEPVFRVVQRGWADPLDASFSRQVPDSRWNPPYAFPALYTCCSERVARAITVESLRRRGVLLDDLQPVVRPQLVEIGWSGEVVDLASAQGVAAAGFPRDYPHGVDHMRTQPVSMEWHTAGREGVLCRSATLARDGFAAWTAPHIPWAELPIFVENARRSPVLLRRRDDDGWLSVIASPLP